MSTTKLRHGKVELALHTLAARSSGPNLLLLHALGERTPDAVPQTLAAWPGPVYGLDFTGHGDSTLPKGGGYTSEVLMADADAALRHLGGATVIGRGLGAYIGLLIAGGRPELVRGAILCDGPGLAGGGPRPGDTRVSWAETGVDRTPDPYALAELTLDVRPPDYATSFVRQANELSTVDPAICVCAQRQPDWLRAVSAEPGVEVTTLDAALELYLR